MVVNPNTRPDGIQTRLQTGAISKKNYATFLAEIPELTSLQPVDSVSGGFSFIADITSVEEPKNFRMAFTKAEWQLAMQEEYNTLKAHGTRILVLPPTNRSVIGSKWVYKFKKNPDGSNMYAVGI